MFGLLEQPAGLFFYPTDAVAGGTVTVGQRPEPVNILSQTNLSLLSCLFSFQTFSLSAKTGADGSVLVYGRKPPLERKRHSQAMVRPAPDV